MTPYYTPPGGLPPQSALHTGRAVFTEAYAVIPRGCFSDIVTSHLPGWRRTRLWIVARPLSGFAETFSHYVMEVTPGGGSDAPDAETAAEHVLFVTRGEGTLSIGAEGYDLAAGAYAFVPPATPWRLWAEGPEPLRLHWIRKLWEGAPAARS
jgi:(S)-ureidoglycine aminohydrolase